MNSYLPEGMLLHTEQNQRAASLQGLREAALSGQILEAPVLLCSESHDLIVDIGGERMVIPRLEAAIGISDGTTRDIAIISRVGKPVCFKAFSTEEGAIALSRRAAQEEALAHFFKNRRPGDIISARVTHLASFGAFVDVGCGIASLIGLESLSVSRISHSSQRLEQGQLIRAVITALDPAGRRISLSMKELLGTWLENASEFSPGQTVAGVVRSVKEYGAFVELAPNLSGLAESSPMLHAGDAVSVYIKAIIPERMKIKLVAIDHLAKAPPRELRYFVGGGHMDSWRYSPEGCAKPSTEIIF